MKLNQKHVLVCDCEGTMPIDGEALAKADGENWDVGFGGRRRRANV